MSVLKKSLISNQVAVKKALIASQATDQGESNELKANSLTAQSMKKKKVNAMAAFSLRAFKAKK
jgi:hypothetical protein